MEGGGRLGPNCWRYEWHLREGSSLASYYSGGVGVMGQTRGACHHSVLCCTGVRGGGTTLDDVGTDWGLRSDTFVIYQEVVRNVKTCLVISF